jgi:hypothetical protein
MVYKMVAQNKLACNIMTDLRQLLAFNMKERRRSLKMSQYRLAELADTSTYYIGMIGWRVNPAGIINFFSNEELCGLP